MNKVLLSVFMVLFMLTGHSQVYVDDNKSISLSVGIPFNISDEGKRVILDSLGLNETSRFNFALSKTDYFLPFNLRFLVGGNRYFFSNDSYYYDVSQFFGFIGFGYEKNLGKRIGFSTNINLGVSFSYQRFQSQDKTQDFYLDAKSSNFNGLTSMSKVYVLLSHDLKFDFRLNEKITLYSQFLMTYLQPGNYGRLNNSLILNNNKFLCLGIAYSFGTGTLN